MARRLLVLSANLISLASLLFFGAVSICLRFRFRTRLVVSHFQDDIGNLFFEFSGDHLDRHFLQVHRCDEKASGKMSSAFGAMTLKANEAERLRRGNLLRGTNHIFCSDRS
jgi:hypothetical protein